MNKTHEPQAYDDPLSAIAAAETLTKHHNKAHRVEATKEGFYVMRVTAPHIGVICEVIYPTELQQKEAEERGKVLPRGWECPKCGIANAPTNKACHCLAFKNAPKQ